MRELSKRYSRHFAALILIVVFALSPFNVVVVASLVATRNGCLVNESAPQPCVILGHDYGALLYQMTVFGWLGLLTVPIAMLLFLGWAVWLAAALVSGWRAAK
jgi:hypothetical protein